MHKFTRLVLTVSISVRPPWHADTGSIKKTGEKFTGFFGFLVQLLLKVFTKSNTVCTRLRAVSAETISLSNRLKSAD